MELEEVRYALLNIFITLLALYLIILSYKQVRPYDFPGLDQRILYTTLAFGFLAFVSFLPRIKLKKGLGLEMRPKNIQRKIKKLVEKRLKYIESFGKWIRRNKLKLGFYLILTLSYFYFLAWLQPKVSSDELAFFILLFYIPISLKFKLDPRYPVGSAIVVLVLCTVSLAQGFENYANRMAIYAYYFLVIGVILLLIDYIRSPEAA